jgi:hypothetical protein
MPSPDKTADTGRLQKAPNTLAPGFGEARTAFETGSLEASTFEQKLQLVRNFDRIESDAARQQVLEFARRLAGQ